MEVFLSSVIIFLTTYFQILILILEQNSPIFRKFEKRAESSNVAESPNSNEKLLEKSQWLLNFNENLEVQVGKVLHLKIL